MKKYILLPLLFFSFVTFAQTESLYYGQEWSQASGFVDSIKTALPNGFKVSEDKLSKSGNSRLILFTDEAGKQVAVDILKFKGESDKIGTISITGNFEAVMSVYTHFVLRGRKLNGQGSGDCWPVVTPEIPGGKLPISFCKNLSKPDSWILGSRMPIK